jgi:WD40 repeat protein
VLHSDGVGTVAVSPDGNRIVSGSADGTVRIWPDPPAVKPTDALCAKLTVNINQSQWQKAADTDIDVPDGCPGLPLSPDK